MSIARRNALAISGLFDGFDALNGVGEFGTVFVPDRLHRFLEWRLVVDVDDLVASGLGLLHRRRLVFVPQIALFELRLAGIFANERLVVLRQGVPGLAGKD